MSAAVTLLQSVTRSMVPAWVPTLAWPLAARAYRLLANLDPEYWYPFTASHCHCALA